MSKKQAAHRPVGAMVVTLARARRITLGQIAERIGVHRNSLTEKIAGRSPFTEDEIILMAEVLGVRPARLFEDPLELLGLAEPSISGSASAWTTRSAGPTFLSMALAA